MLTRALIVVATLWLSACAPSSTSMQPTAASVELSLRMSDGRPFLLSSLRGKPVVLFLFATYDAASQLLLTRLEARLARDPSTTIVGIALQPDAERLLSLYQQTLSVSFLLTYDPDRAILGGETGLGDVAAVPALVVLDPQGHERERHYGDASDAKLDDLLETDE